MKSRKPKVIKDLYVLLAGDYVKVGISTDVNKRLTSMQSSCPLEIKILALWLRGADHEKQLLKTLTEKGLHERGEWFRIDALGHIWEYFYENKADCHEKYRA